MSRRNILTPRITVRQRAALKHLLQHGTWSATTGGATIASLVSRKLATHGGITQAGVDRLSVRPGRPKSPERLRQERQAAARQMVPQLDVGVAR